MRLFTNIAVSAAVSLLVFIGAYKYLPLNWLETTPTHHGFGSTITTIQGTDTISGSRTTINTNFANLNADKIEATQTTLSSLSSIGTIISGIWHGTTIDPAYGGTGSTTLAKFNILLGSSTNPIGIVQGLGTSGQFLTSAGAGAPPAWQTAAIDQTANYNWTGLNLFKSFTASSTITFSNAGAGLSFTFPSGTRSASSTFLAENGSGNLTFVKPNGWNFFEDTAQYSLTGSTASTTVDTIPIPAGTFANGTRLEIIVIPDSTEALNAGIKYDIQVGTGSASTTIAAMNLGVSNTYTPIHAYLQATTTASEFSYQEPVLSTVAQIITPAYIPYSNAAKLYLSVRYAPINSADTARIIYVVVRQTF